MRFEDERRAAALADLCGCPGLFVGQYEDIDLLPSEWIERRYEGGAGFIGMAKAYPTDAAQVALKDAQ